MRVHLVYGIRQVGKTHKALRICEDLMKKTGYPPVTFTMSRSQHLYTEIRWTEILGVEEPFALEEFKPVRRHQQVVLCDEGSLSMKPRISDFIQTINMLKSSGVSDLVIVIETGHPNNHLLRYLGAKREINLKEYHVRK